MILVVSPPRSGSSLFANILYQNNFNTGNLKKGDINNKLGYFENIKIDNYLSEIMNIYDEDNLGKRFNPINKDYFIDDFKKEISRHIDISNCFIKNIKIAFTWKLWHKKFPNAKVIFLYRDLYQILESYKKTPFMNQYDNDLDWLNYLCSFYINMNEMKKNFNHISVYMNDIVNSNKFEMEKINSFLNMELNYKNIINHNLWAKK